MRVTRPAPERLRRPPSSRIVMGPRRAVTSETRARPSQARQGALAVRPDGPDAGKAYARVADVNPGLIPQLLTRFPKGD